MIECHKQCAIDEYIQYIHRNTSTKKALTHNFVDTIDYDIEDIIYYMIARYLINKIYIQYNRIVFCMNVSLCTLHTLIFAPELDS